MTTDATQPALSTRLQAAFDDEEFAALRLLTRARLGVIAVILIWVHVENPLPMALSYDPFVIAFLIPTLAPYLLRRAGVVAAWPRYLFPLVDMLLMVVTALVPNMNGFPRQMVLRFENELYLFLLLTSSVLCYSPAVVLWAGFCAASLWALGSLWIYLLPDTVIGLPAAGWMLLSPEQRLAVALDPYRVNAGMLGRQVLLMLVVAAVLALAVRRSRALLLRQVSIERERANLSRYFSPNMVEELAQSDVPLRATRTQPAAVLFADIVGFTHFSATQPAEAVIARLREFHARMAQAVFDHGGTLNKFLGDGVMATFGTPQIGPQDAVRALRCAKQMLAVVADWNRELPVQHEPIHIGVGVHFGTVILGDIGDERHLEFAVVGDTVNVASRLQQLTRQVHTCLLASHALVQTARAQSGFRASDLDGLSELGELDIRGHDQRLRVWQADADGQRTGAAHDKVAT